MIDAIRFAYENPARRCFDDSPGAGSNYVDRSEGVLCVRAVQKYCVAERPHAREQSKRIGLVGQRKHSAYRQGRTRAA